MRSILLYLLDNNLPLSKWPEYKHIADEGPVSRSYSYYGFGNPKEVHNMVQALIGGCSQPVVVEQLARELFRDDFPSIIRVRFMQRANELRQNGSVSNNVSKGLKRLDDMTGGKVMALNIGPTERTLQVIGGRKVSVDRRIDPAVAGASRAFSGYALPPNFSKLPKAEQKRIRQQLAAERRELKRR